MSANQKKLDQQINTLALKKSWYWYVLAGVIMLIGGGLALAKPFAASVTVELITGWTFVFAGLLQLVHAFRGNTGTASRIWTVLVGLLAIFLGVSLLANPLAGVLSMTIIVGILIAASGVMKLFYAFKMRPNQGWFWVFVSALVSIALAVLILGNLAGSGLATLGILLAVELISSGVLWIMIGFGLKKLSAYASTGA